MSTTTDRAATRRDLVRSHDVAGIMRAFVEPHRQSLDVVLTETPDGHPAKERLVKDAVADLAFIRSVLDAQGATEEVDAVDALLARALDGSGCVGARWNDVTHGVEHVEANGDRTCVEHDMWLDPTEEGCGNCYVASRGGFRR